MQTRLLALVSLVLVCAFSAMTQSVVENESTVTIDNGTANIKLVVDSDRRTTTMAEIGLYSPQSDKAVKKAAITKQLNSGRQIIEIALPITDIVSNPNEDIAWYRLGYTVGNATGIISLSQMIRGLFELRVSSSRFIASGMIYRTRVYAVDPISGGGVAGVAVSADVEIELIEPKDEKLKLRGESITDENGYANIDVSIPIDAKLDSDGEVEVRGARSGIVKSARSSLNTMGNDMQFLQMLDKPIYQPGQILRIRGILLKGSDEMTVMADAEVEFRFEDENDTLLYREKVRASEFGIASASWTIPANALLGQYNIKIYDGGGEQIGGQSFRVTRYDLPNFVVNAKPTKPYYLPADSVAEIEIRADYLFGKPVSKGKVRVVEETERSWDWKTQKYDVDEGESREGETDADSKFVAKFDLKDWHDDISDDSWRKYKDVNLVAYFTDPTTNRTEQRRFDVRVTREPIHVYFDYGTWNVNSRLATTGFVTAFYADGKPAECEVEISAAEDEDQKFQPLKRIVTNVYGAGKFIIKRPNIGDANDDLDFRVKATDRDGRVGTKQQEVDFNDVDDAELTIDTDKTIYKPGEMMTVRVRSTERNAVVNIDVTRRLSVLDSRAVRLRNGSGEVAFPYNEKFRDGLTLSAYIDDPGDEDELIQAARGVIFPAGRSMAVEAKFDQVIYKPNDEATVDFSVTDSLGNAIESALGVVIFDKAVEERARTDSEFSGMFNRYSGFLGYGENLGTLNTKNLNELDLSKPIGEDLQLAAELMLRRTPFPTSVYRSESYDSTAKTFYGGRIALELAPIGAALQYHYKEKYYDHPVDDASLRRILSFEKVDLDSFRDPWGTQYKSRFEVVKTNDVVSLVSAGPDKQFDTSDDFTAVSEGFAYFTHLGKAIDTTAGSYLDENSDIIRSEASLLGRLGMAALVDRYGRNYKVSFDVDGKFAVMKIITSGADGEFHTYEGGGDDTVVWTTRLDLFAKTETLLQKAVADIRDAPMDEFAFRSALKLCGIDLENLRDGRGTPLYVLAERRSRYWDRVTFETVQFFGSELRTERRVVTPVTQEVMEFTIKGVGNNGERGNWDDVTFARYVFVLSEQAAGDSKPVVVSKPISYALKGGSISGTVVDPNGAIISGATVAVTSDADTTTRSATTNADGYFIVGNLLPGTYTVKANANGFKSSVTSGVKVTAGSITDFKITLEIGGVSSVVEVTGDAASTIDTSNTSMALSINGRRMSEISELLPKGVNFASLLKVAPSNAGKTKPADDPISTPRVREYFPETLVWQPEVITGADGRAQIKFRMADNITTWKVYTIASTKKGQIAVSENEVAAFQSFFVDLDPPKFLTVGDEIFLPTQVRNYTDKQQKVAVSMSGGGWFDMLSEASKNVEVDSGRSENAVFGFRASSVTKDGKQKVTAIAQTDSDAIERSVVVRPNGNEVVSTNSQYFQASHKFQYDIPSDALAPGRAAELRIYPNLMAHVSESVEGLLRRPYGCGEQTVSSTYPNLMILKFAASGANSGISDAVERKAKKFLQSGYERLLSYQTAEGGFSYWGGKDVADLALTVYAMRFLVDSSTVIAVDPDALKRAESWLMKQQQPDGSWSPKYRWETSADSKRSVSTTAYIASTLARISNGKANANADVLKKAFGFLAIKTAQLDEPYSLALTGLAAIDSGDEKLARGIAGRLRTIHREEAGNVYWNLESNTVFNGWGTAGRIETTALVTRLLVRLDKDDPLAAKAMPFLISSKDRYGVWYSTQTTINVLDTFISMLGSEIRGTQSVRVVVNGNAVKTIEIAPDKLDLIVVDLAAHLTGSSNTVELVADKPMPLMAQLVTTHYVGWANAKMSERVVTGSSALKLENTCDKQTAEIMAEIKCSVNIGRIGYQGYGMLVAEIGTPPGADVSRETLEAVIENNWKISKYEILPDRILFYLWSQAGGTRFNYTFKPRYGINALTPASIAYDYYNPEARALVEPLRFVVR